MEKTASQVARELLDNIEKTSTDAFEEIRQNAYNNEIQKIAEENKNNGNHAGAGALVGAGLGGLEAGRKIYSINKLPAFMRKAITGSPLHLNKGMKAGLIGGSLAAGAGVGSMIGLAFKKKQDQVKQAAYNDELKKFGFDIGGAVNKGVSYVGSKVRQFASNVPHLANKEYRGMAAKEMIKNPVAMGAAGLAAGAGTMAAMPNKNR